MTEEREIKQAQGPVSMRLNHDDVTRFKELKESLNISQAELFALAVGALELEQTKNTIGANREKEIETFQQLCAQMVNLYVNSVQMNDIAEKGIRQELDEKLAKQEKKVKNLRDRLDEADINLRESAEKEREFASIIKVLETEVAELKKRLQQAEKLSVQKDAHLKLIEEKLEAEQQELESAREKVEKYDAIYAQYEEVKMSSIATKGELKTTQQKLKDVQNIGVELGVKNELLETDNIQKRLELVKLETENKSLKEKVKSLTIDRERLLEDCSMQRTDYKERLSELKERLVEALETKQAIKPEHISQFDDEDAFDLADDGL